MSDAVSALQGRVATGDVTIADAGLQGMITLRCDLSAKSLKAACKTMGLAIPERGQISRSGDKALCWMSPDELLMLVPYADVAGSLASVEQGMKGQHYLAENVSDARALIHIDGPFARDVIAKLAPVDLHPDSFKPGMVRRTHLGQIAAAFWMRDDGAFELICFRSVAAYAFDLLAASAKAGPVSDVRAS
ncbi:sarcosine oxidase subunit gamma [Yoonia sediminilitoris]|uniref:Sarcosine oxidase subunit gamma n=1 Tax=Yoonia sediminilitoris TaxID=1286148 RepID=A0A2T6KDU3_9RHOB|nr:sarcosine oxidase subunit gamma family protein [Yoonia sediminilitoris]PUB13209.1 sarcosine oxidase subunit gamma [Yoonia sediminilitoris]RCW94544.1 sarcosine oxidase subunit gamma [Yoonia sediminilitoris]